MSTGLSYYLAGSTYNFQVTVQDPDATAWADHTSIQLVLANGFNIIFSSANGAVGTNRLLLDPAEITSGDVEVMVTFAGTFNNFTATFAVKFTWDSPNLAWGAAGGTRNVAATATSSNPLANSMTNTQNLSYGISTQIRVINFAQDGQATDGKVNPWHAAFNVTGTIVYDIPGAAVADAVPVLELGNNTADDLTLNHSGGGTIQVARANPFTFPVIAERMSTLPWTWATVQGNRTWSVTAEMASTGGPETSTNTLAINCDKIEVQDVVFIGGGGVNAAPLYHRNVAMPGAQVQVTARMENGLGTMQGDTTIRIQDSSAGPNSYDVVILNGQNTGTANLLPYPTVPAQIPNEDTTPLTYQAVRVFGGAYDGDTALAQGQDAAIKITQPAARTTYWDSNDPPGNGTSLGGTPFTPVASFSATPSASSLTFTWNPAAAPARLTSNEDMDFYTYRIYYRLTSNPDPPVFSIIDRNTAGFLFLSSRLTTNMTITGLVPFTQYDYYLTAVDVYGQEVFINSGVNYTTGQHNGLYIGAPAAVGGIAGDRYYSTILTNQSSTTVVLTDGINTYDNSSFAATPAVGPVPPGSLPAPAAVRATNIRVDVTVITGGTLPNSVNLILADETTISALGPAVNGLIDKTTAQLAADLTLNTDYYRIGTTKTGPNTYTAYIPFNHPLMLLPIIIKFNIETFYNGVYSYVDQNSSIELVYNPNDVPWRFTVSTAATFTPWPTRILNNVLDAANPTAYPAYYLSEDASVSIRVYDVKGRPVKTLLENASRKGGQNIKEGGWDGTNKANRKVGVGLYYVHFRAVNGSGKVILNEFLKVVMAH